MSGRLGLGAGVTPALVAAAIEHRWSAGERASRNVYVWRSLHSSRQRANPDIL